MDYSGHKFDSSGWATREEIAPLLDPKARGPQLGYFLDSGEAIKSIDQAPILTLGGARSGKGSGVLVPICLGGGYSGEPPSILINDPAGENLAVTLPHQIQLGRPVYCYNPTGMHPHILPQHSCNPLDFLHRDDPELFALCTLAAQWFIMVSGGSNATFFEDFARRWFRSCLYWRVLSEGKTSLPDVWDFLRDLDGSEKAFNAAILEMTTHPRSTPEVRKDAAEMQALKAAPKTYIGVMSSLNNDLGVLADPLLAKSLRGGDFSLEYLVNPEKCKLGPPIIGVVCPVEYKSIWRSVTRGMIGSAMLYALRSKNRHIRPYFLIDEMASLGHAEFMVSAFSEGPKAFQVHAVIQSIGQLERHYERAGAREILSSAGILQYIGGREQDTTELISKMLGEMTLGVIDPRNHAERKHAFYQALRSILLYDVDPLEAIIRARHENAQSIQNEYLSRRLLTPSEVGSMPKNRQVILAAGYSPILAEKRAYWEDPNFARTYFPNPYFAPKDQVQVQGRRGPEWVKVKAVAVPEKLAHWPQHQSGKMWVYA